MVGRPLEKPCLDKEFGRERKATQVLGEKLCIILRKGDLFYHPYPLNCLSTFVHKRFFNDHGIGLRKFINNEEVENCFLDDQLYDRGILFLPGKKDPFHVFVLSGSSLWVAPPPPTSVLSCSGRIFHFSAHQNVVCFFCFNFSPIGEGGRKVWKNNLEEIWWQTKLLSERGWAAVKKGKEGKKCHKRNIIPYRLAEVKKKKNEMRKQKRRRAFVFHKKVKVSKR